MTSSALLLCSFLTVLSSFLFTPVLSSNRCDIVTAVSGPAALGLIGQSNFSQVLYSDCSRQTLSTNGGPVRTDPSRGDVYVVDNGSELRGSRILRFRYAQLLAHPIFPTPDLVVGFATFNDCSVVGNISASALHSSSPEDLQVDSLGRLWVVDTGNHRVMAFNAISSISQNGPSANLIIGQKQADHSRFSWNASAQSLSDPATSWYESAHDRLWIADRGNYRVLRFDNVNALFSQGLTPYPAAAGVIGQPNLNSNNGSLPNGFRGLVGLAFDSNGNLYVGDSFYNSTLGVEKFHVRRYSAASLATFNPSPSAVLNLGVVNSPAGWAFNPVDGDLILADTFNNRVLVFHNIDVALPGPHDILPNIAFGQPDTSSVAANRGGGPAANSLYSPVGVESDPYSGALWVADSLNDRVVRYCSFPSTPSVTKTVSRTRVGSQTRTASETHSASITDSVSRTKSHSLAKSASTTHTSVPSVSASITRTTTVSRSRSRSKSKSQSKSKSKSKSKTHSKSKSKS